MKKSFVVAGLCLVLAALASCGPEAAPEAPQVDGVVIPAGGQGGGGARAKVASDWRLRHDLVAQEQFAVRDRDGLLAIDLGEVAARKHLGGGWRTGWRPEIKQDGQERYLEADSKSARVFFKHKARGFDRIAVRMRSPARGNKATVYVNDQALTTVAVGEGWEEHVFEVPPGATVDGENQLMMRFSRDATVDKRTQAAHVAWVKVLPAKADPADAPRGPRVQEVSFDNEGRHALVAATPQTYTWRLQLPEGTPKLAFGWAARKPGARLEVTVEADEVARATIFSAGAGANHAGGWHDQVVELGAFAGRVVELRLSVGGTWEAGQLVAWGTPGVYTPGTEAVKVPRGGKPARNVLVYLIDTMRYDHIGAYNPKSPAKTPNLDAFAAEATLFEHAYDNENWTKPSCATILTGLLPETHQTKEDRSKLPQEITTLPEHLKAQGFSTASFIANGYVSRAFGFDQGWDHHTNYIREGKVTDADHVVNDTLAWIDAHKKERFFTYVQTIDPHVPYSPPGEYRKMYWNRKYNGPIKSRSTGDQLAEIKTGKLKVGPEDKQYLQALYSAEVTFNDTHFGRLIQGLKDRGLYEDTVVVVIADHGEEFWDHGSVGHGHSLYEEMIHSPLIVRAPGRTVAGARVGQVVSMVDLAPTLLDLVGITGHDALEGVSFVDAFDGVGEARPRVAVSDFLYRLKSVRAGRYKWISGGRDGQLYDVVADKGDEKNLIKRHAIARAFVRSQFGMFMGAREKRSWWTAGADDATTLRFEADVAEIDDDLQAQLEAMGYVEGARGDDEGEEDEADAGQGDKE